MFLKKLTILLLLISTIDSIYSQSTVDYSLYSNSLNLINPAFAGYNNNSELILDSKTQWVGINQSPQTNTISFNTPLKKNLGLGVNIINDKLFIFNQTQISADFSYKLKVDDENDFIFGIKVMGNLYSGDIHLLKTDVADDDFFKNPINKSSINFTAGGAIVNENYFMHLSIRNLLSDKRYEQLEKSENITRLDLLAGGGYTFKINKDLGIKPSILAKIMEGTPSEFDLNSTFVFNQKYEAGLSYFWNNSLQITALGKFVDFCTIGYGYRFYVNEIGPYQNGTHEVILKVDINKML